MPRRAAGWAWAIWGAGAAVYLGAFVWAMRVLPERVVAHIGPSGEVDRWGSRTEHAVLSVVLGVGILALPWLFHATTRAPVTFVNLPNKEYWFATPERVATVRARIVEDGLIFSGITALFVAVVLQVGIVRATEDPAAGDGGVFVVGLVLYLVATAVWIVMLHRRYRLPDGADG
jgi:uncharacterized membrane protein